MKKLSAKDKMMLLAMAGVLLIGGLFMFYVKPAKADLQTQSDRAASASDNVTKLNTQLQQLVAQAKPNKQSETNVADTLRLAKAYPSDQDLPEAILELERIAKQAGVAFTDGTPDEGADVAGTTGTTFAITVRGSYFRVQDFIYRLHNQVNVDLDGRIEINGRLFAITGAELKPAGSEEGSATITSTSPIEATITAIAFSRTPAAAATPTTPTTNPTPAPSANSGGTNE